MTFTPPPGNFPPPPPGNYPPPQGYQAPQGYPAPAALPAAAYTPWITRVLATLIDQVPYAVVLGIGLGIEAATQETACITDTSGLNLGDVCATGNSTLGVAAVMVAALVGIVYMIWNLGYRQGTMGSSIGKSM